MQLKGELLFWLQVAFNHPVKPSEDPRAGAEQDCEGLRLAVLLFTTERNKNCCGTALAQVVLSSFEKLI